MSYLSIKDWKARQIQGSRSTESTGKLLPNKDLFLVKLVILVCLRCHIVAT